MSVDWAHILPSPAFIQSPHPPAPLPSDSCQSAPCVHACVSTLSVYSVRCLPHISEVPRYLSLSGWLISLGVVLSRSIHTAVKGKVSFVFTAVSQAILEDSQYHHSRRLLGAQHNNPATIFFPCSLYLCGQHTCIACTPGPVGIREKQTGVICPRSWGGKRPLQGLCRHAQREHRIQQA